MKRIVLCCASGMSTSMLVARMQKYAEEKGLAVAITAVSVNEFEAELPRCDCCLLGPQIKYKLEDIKEKLVPLDIPVAVINTLDYGMMRGDRVLETALAMM